MVSLSDMILKSQTLIEKNILYENIFVRQNIIYKNVWQKHNKYPKKVKQHIYEIMKKCVRQISIRKCLTKHEKIQTSKKNMSDNIYKNIFQCQTK